MKYGRNQSGPPGPGAGPLSDVPTRRTSLHDPPAHTTPYDADENSRCTIASAEIGIDLFFLIPSSGTSILTFGIAGDPDDHLWKRVGEIVSAVVRQTVGSIGRGAVKSCARRPTT